MGNSQNTHSSSQLYNDPAYMNDEKNSTKDLKPDINKNSLDRKSLKKEPIIKRNNYQKCVDYEIVSTLNFIDDSIYNLNLFKINSMLTNLDKYNTVVGIKNKFEISIDENANKKHSIIKGYLNASNISKINQISILNFQEKSPITHLNESNVSKINQVSILNFQENSQEKEKPISFFKKKNLEIETSERISFRELFEKDEMKTLKFEKKPQVIKETSEKLNDLKNDLIFFTPIYSSDMKYKDRPLPRLTKEESILTEIENKGSFHSEKEKNVELEVGKKKMKYNSLSVRTTPKKKNVGKKIDLNKRSCNCSSKERINHIHISLNDLITKDKSNSNFNKFKHITYKKKEDNSKFKNSYYNSFSYAKNKFQKENIKKKHEINNSKYNYYPDVNNYDSSKKKNKSDLSKNNTLYQNNLSNNSNFKNITLFNDIPQPAQKDNKLCLPENLGLSLQNSQTYIPSTGYRAYSEDSDESENSN